MSQTAKAGRDEKRAAARKCIRCGEPEDGGQFGWFDAQATGKSVTKLVCNACGHNPKTGKPVK